MSGKKNTQRAGGWFLNETMGLTLRPALGVFLVTHLLIVMAPRRTLIYPGTASF